MKSFFLAAAFFLCIISPERSLASNTKIKSTCNKPLNVPVVLMLLLNDGCFHRVRMNPPGYISSNGTYYETWSMTILSPQDYVGTLTICPEPGTAYC